VRLLSITMHPRVLDDLGLPAALKHLAREMKRNGEIEFHVDAPASTPMLAREHASVLYRVAQEAVVNAVRHGGPSSVWIRLDVEGGDATLEVSDDGSGFDSTVVSRDAAGLGIFSMRERAALVGGSFELTSRPGAGTRVRATVPSTSPAISSGRP
jgi:two-component system, NarL family, sensor kinase